MTEYYVELRYFPGDPLEQIREKDLQSLGKDHKVKISYEKIENRVLQDGFLMENTMDKPIEEISQEVIKVSSDSEDDFSRCIKKLYEKYRCPRASYSLLGSNDSGRKIAWGLMNMYGGW
ncbi:MAG: hypothetical protein ABSH41_31105 [Syntrophobacteraceae bacterium]|jgi:hypothetical protein